MATSSLTTTALAFDNGVNFATFTATSDGLVTCTSNAGDVNLAGIAVPTADSHAANKVYVDSVVNGLSWKEVCVAATTTPGALATSFAAGQVIDGVTLALDDRILIKDQGTGSENGIYIVTAGAATRAPDMPTGSSASGNAVFVDQGTTNADTAFVCTNTKGSDVVGTDALVFVAFTSNTVLAGTNLTKTGNTINFPGQMTTNLEVTTAGSTIIMASGSIVDSAGSIDFANNNLTTTGVATATSFSASSDERLKGDVELITDPLERLSNIRGVTFKWLKTGKDDVGVIAQEVQRVQPQVVTNTADGFLAVDYGRLTPLLIEAVKTLSARLEALESSV